MKKKPTLILWYIVSLFLLVVAYGYEIFQSEINLRSQYIKAFQLRLTEKEKFLNRHIEEVSLHLPPDSITDYFGWFGHSAKGLDQKGLILLVYKNDSIVYWSDNRQIFPLAWRDSTYQKKLLFLGNTWGTPVLQKAGAWNIVGLICIKHEYQYENKFLKTEFHEDFRLPPQIILSRDRLKNYQHFIISSTKGNPLFVLNVKEDISFDELPLSFPVLLYILSFSFFIYGFRRYLLGLNHRGKHIQAVLFLALGLFMLRFLMMRFHWPAAVYRLDLFSPGHYAASRFLPSLGDLFLHALMIVLWVYNATRGLRISWKNDHHPLGILSILVRYVILFALFYGLHLLYKSLVMDSDISFEARNVLDLSIYSFVGLLSMAFLFLSLGLLADKIITGGQGNFRVLPNVSVLGFFTIILLYPAFLSMGIPGIISVILFSAFLFIIILIRSTQSSLYNFSAFVLMVLLFALYSVILADYTQEIKEKERGRILAMSLATEHDPVAEMMLEGLGDKLREDALILEKINSGRINIDEMYDHIRRNYFNGYWNKYDLQITLCQPDDSLLIQPDNKWEPCFSFFDALLNSSGVALSDSGFYFLDNRNGRISYFTKLEYGNTGRKFPSVLFIQLDSKPVSEDLGYPELLLDQRVIRSSSLHGYSYAKYYKNNLITQLGDFAFSLSGKEFEGSNEFEVTWVGGYQHMIYRNDPENIIVLSKPEISSYDRIIAFSYIFGFFFLISVFLYIISSPQQFMKGFVSSFRNRIQYSMILLLLISLLIVGGGSIYFSIRQYKAKHKEILSEKMQSVVVELTHKLSGESVLVPGWRAPGYENLEELLRKFSNVFYSDINLYTQEGTLLATSRPEIFQVQLTGELMNPDAYREMHEKRKAEYIHNESIGNLKFLSAYIPFTNRNGELLAYLNLPYFTKQNILTGEISNLIVAFVNVYLILILISISLAVFISKQITHPLSMVQAKLREVKLGKKYEKIEYKGNDEVAGLVDEYNRMLDELEESTEKLARSERETAWREMARQIAHEIKNPLTPMKLSVQHLQRAWDDKAPQFGDLFKRLMATLSEQIDNLSHIASEFSSFATLPRTHYTEVDLLPVIRNAITLFEQTDNIVITYLDEGLQDAKVWADRDQISRVVINLLKNAIQSIPEGRQGLISVSLKAENQHFLCSVKDNGSGIAEEQKERMFQPNFTTKTGGMGLGLAMVKRIIDSSGGKIWFETSKDQGSVFYFQLPVYIS